MLDRVFIAYTRHHYDNEVVSGIVTVLNSRGYNTHFDLEQSNAGDDHASKSSMAIKDSGLFIIFLSTNRRRGTAFDAELILIQDAYRHNPKLVIIPVLLHKDAIVDDWLKPFSHLLHFSGAEATLRALNSSLEDWKKRTIYIPDDSSAELREKSLMDPHSKEALSRWLLSNSSRFLKHKSIILGCGTTICDIWVKGLRKLYINASDNLTMYTINGLILNHEPDIELRQLGDKYDEFYHNYIFEQPNGKFSGIDLAIISVSGFRTTHEKLELKVCHDYLIDTLKAILHEARKEVIILAAGRKLCEPQGNTFIDNLLEIGNSSNPSKRKLTIVVDNIWSETNSKRRRWFREAIKKVTMHFGEPRRMDEIIYWETHL